LSAIYPTHLATDYATINSTDCTTNGRSDFAAQLSALSVAYCSTNKPTNWSTYYSTQLSANRPAIDATNFMSLVSTNLPTK
jgi:hypothetical protein